MTNDHPWWQVGAMMLMGLVALAGPLRAEPPAVAVIPQPARVDAGGEAFVVTGETVLIAAGAARAEAEQLAAALSPAMGFTLPIVEGEQPSGGSICLRLDGEHAAELGDEGYILAVTADAILIEAARPAGLFYGVQTLRQLLPAAVFARQPAGDATWVVPGVRITDRPRFGWRGLLVDPARHFLPKFQLLDFIDLMALHKFNRLQLHLTDDQGWRIEIKKYPRLTDRGAWRDETLVGHLSARPHQFDGRTYGGYYTQDDVREIVRYAARRHITVVPEIEMPGHARAAISAYPHLGVFPEQQRDLRPWTRWGISEDIFAPRKETVAFLQDVLLEVMELFPGEFIHVGGDEAVKVQWQRSDEVQQIMRELGLKDEAELQSDFIARMDRFLAEHGRRLIGWDEILEGGLAPGATVMSWRGEAGGIAAAKAGHDVVMAPHTHTYLDYYQGAPAEEPLAIGGLITLERIYGYEPIPASLTAEEARHVLGAQAQLWSEYIPNYKHMQYMAFPRAVAMAEVTWSPRQRRDYNDFLKRLRPHLDRLDALDVNYRPL